MLDEIAARRALKMVGDRNLSVHTYNEMLAKAIFARLAEHADVMVMWLREIEHRVGQLGEA